MSDLLLAPPSFDLLFSIDGVDHIVEALPVHQPADMPVIRDTLDSFILVLPYSTMKAARHPGIKQPGSVRDDVHVIPVFAHSSALPLAGGSG